MDPEAFLAEHAATCKLQAVLKLGKVLHAVLFPKTLKY